MAKKLKIFNGSSWEDVTFAITPPNTAVTNSFTTNQVIDTSTSVAALRVTQRGTGEAFRVEDDSNPDSSPFVIDAVGSVGIGTSSPSSKLHISGDLRVSGANANIYLQNTGSSITSSINQWTNRLEIVSGNEFGISINNTVQGHSFYINANNNASFNLGTNLSVNMSSTPKFEVQSGAIKIWAGKNGALEGGEMYLASSGGANTYSNTNDAVFDWYDGMVRLSPDGFNKIYMLRPANDNGTSIGLRNTTASTSTPSGGQDGDVWLTYTA